MKKPYITLLLSLFLVAGSYSQCTEIWNNPNMPLCGPAGILKTHNNQILLLSGNQYCQPSQTGSAHTMLNLLNGSTLNEYIDTIPQYSINWLDESNNYIDTIVEVMTKGVSANGQWHSLVGKINTNTLLMDTIFVYPSVDSVPSYDLIFSTTTKKNGKSYYTASSVEVPLIPGPESLKLHCTKMDENGIMVWRRILNLTSALDRLGYSNTTCHIITDNLIVSSIHGNAQGGARIYAHDSTGGLIFGSDLHLSNTVWDIQNVLGIFRNQNNSSFFAVCQIESPAGGVRIKEYSFAGTLLNSVDINAPATDPNFKIMNIMEALPLSNGNILIYGDGSPTAAEWWKSEVFGMIINPNLQETWFQKFAYAQHGKSMARDIIVWDTAHFDVVGWFLDSALQGNNYLDQGLGVVRMNTDNPPQLCYYNDTVTHSSSIYLFAEKLNEFSEFVVAFQGNRAEFTTNSGSTVIKIGESLGLGNEALDMNDPTKIYPNPSAGIVFIDSPHEIDKVEMYDLHGRMLYSNLGLSQIDVSHLTAGTYLLYIYSDQNVTHKKIIVSP